MAGPAPNWKTAEPFVSLRDVVAVPGAYKITVQNAATARLSWQNLTRSLQVRLIATGTVFVGFSKAGVLGTNRFPVSDLMPYAETLETDAVFIRNESGGALDVYVNVVLGDKVVTGTTPAFALANDGVSTSVAVDNPAP